MNGSIVPPTDPLAGEVGVVAYHDFTSDEPFSFDCGRTIGSFTLRYETYGKLSAARDNAILICHALSGDHHAAGIHRLNDPKPGWWNNMIGPGKPFDTNRFFVICSNCLGGCQGSTGPSSVDPETGRPYNLSFPVTSIADMVRAQVRLLDHLGIERLACVSGGSMGGMQALQWAVSYPDRVRKVLPLATTARQNVQAVAFNAVGRAAIQQDPDWHGGDYPPDAGPRFGLSIARMMAHITYLSDKGLEEKFGPRRRDGRRDPHTGEHEFEVESYLHYQGRSFVNRFDARTYLTFTHALDHFDIQGDHPTLSDALAPVTARVLTVGFTSDWLFPPAQNRAIVKALLQRGKDASYLEVQSDFGHDSFLIRSELLETAVRNFLLDGES